MDSRPGDEMPLLAAAERDIDAFCTLCERHAGWLATRPGVLPDGTSRWWGA